MDTGIALIYIGVSALAAGVLGLLALSIIESITHKIYYRISTVILIFMLIGAALATFGSVFALRALLLYV